MDDGASWTVAAEELPNASGYLSMVPDVTTEQARLEIMAVYAMDETGVIPESESVISDAFTIGLPTGVANGSAVLALRPTSPATGPLTAAFSLSSDAPATLTAYDVGGRRTAALEVGSQGSGSHTMDLGRLPCGIYPLRHTQAGRTLKARVLVLR